MSQATISLYCPPMRIYHDGKGMMKTASEPMTATITFPGSAPLVIGNVVIPSVAVNKQSVFKWLVEACSANGRDAAGNSIMIAILPQAVNFSGGKITAKSVQASGSLTLKDGKIGRIQLVFPDCNVNPLPLTAEACTATGTVTFP